jgi:ABC-type multidrug transport system permease subunit
MRWLPNYLVILAVVGILIGLVVRVMKGGFLGDPVFFWRGSVVLLAIAIAISLIQIRDK